MKHRQILQRGINVLLSLLLYLTLLPMTVLAEGTSVEINEANFPDANFRAYVSEKFDTDKDGTLSATEIAAATEIDCSYSGIESLQGIEHFTALTKLICNRNYLTSLDISSNTALKHLECGKTWLTNLNVSNNTALEYLDCGTNYLTSLDVSKNDKLQQLVCDTNNLTSLDVSKNNALQTLYCTSNTYDVQLGENSRTFDLSNLPGNFDVNKASDWKGGSVDNNGILTFTDDVVTYKYACGYGDPATFTLDGRTKHTVTVQGGLYGYLGMSGLPCGKDGVWGTYAKGEEVWLYVGTRADSGYTLEGLEFDGIAKDDFIWAIPQDVEDIQRCGHFTMPAKDVKVTVKWKKTDTPDTPDTPDIPYIPDIPNIPQNTDKTDTIQDGWVEENGNWYYYTDNAAETGWQKIGGAWYYLDPRSGAMAESGMQEIDGEIYYFYDWGGMASYFWYLDEEGDWYYFGGNGAMVENKWVLCGGKWYYLGSDGAMVENKWILTNGVWYYLGSDGAMLTNQWLYWNGAWYYLGADGAMLTDTVTPDGYYVGKDGVWVK